jgi:cytochrome c5
MILAVILCAAALAACSRQQPAVVDAAKAAGKTAADFPQSAADYFKDMDGGIALTPDEVKGRNTWMTWTAGNEAFWDYMANHSFGSFDLLKVLDSRGRGSRFRVYGLMNDPGFRQASRPDRFGLWLDERTAPPEPFDASIYGRPSGILGLRLYPNPRFTGAARARWNARRYYEDPSYYDDPGLVRPYRVGMACAFCHVGPHPLHPPADPERPAFANLAANVGSQYFRAGAIFANNLALDNFVWQVFNAYPPGTVDTSLLATDDILNPRTMNAIYSVGPRLAAAHVETMAGGALHLPEVQAKGRSFAVPHVLKEGADSVGILGALSRVYVSIGEFHEEWLRHFIPLIGGKRQTPIDVGLMQQRSTYWLATQDRVANVAAYFLEAAVPHPLAEAPGGAAYLTRDAALLHRGRTVFAERCAACHSSKQPPGLEPRTPEYFAWMRRAVQSPGFLDGNYLSTESRYPITLIGSNACASLATNALRGHIWDDFSSETYKTLPAVGKIEIQNPVTGARSAYEMPGGGRGYLRPPTLISVWASAPYLHNNSLGTFNGDPSTAGRMAAFEDGIEKLLWPEKRAEDDCAAKWGLPFCGPVYRTTRESWLIVNQAFLPAPLRPLLDRGELRIGPIPKGTPIGLLANLNLEVEPKDVPGLLRLLVKVKRDLLAIRFQHLDEKQSAERLADLVPDLLAYSKCPDFTVNRGHTFGSDLSDADKRALIEVLKTF